MRISDWSSDVCSSDLLFFSSPPGEARLVAIDRRLDNTPNPLTSQQLREALVAKYGTPASDDGQALRWLFPEGKVECVINSGAYSPNQTDFMHNVFHGGVAGHMHKQQHKDWNGRASWRERVCKY